MRPDYITKMIAGQKALVELPPIPDDAPTEIREGIARRRLTVTTGTCPCGAVMTGPNRAQRRQMKKDRANGIGVWEVSIPHEPDCPAVDSRLLAAIKTWRGQ